VVACYCDCSLVRVDMLKGGLEVRYRPFIQWSPSATFVFR
jgi:hypothetical protein